MQYVALGTRPYTVVTNTSGTVTDIINLVISLLIFIHFIIINYKIKENLIWKMN